MPEFELDGARRSPRVAFVFGQQQATGGRSVVAGQIGEFLIEVLEAQAEAEGLGVFEEEFAGLGDLLRRFGLSKRKTFHHRGHRGTQGSLRTVFRFGESFPLCPLWLER
jgi:hypothetical protein